MSDFELIEVEKVTKLAIMIITQQAAEIERLRELLVIASDKAMEIADITIETE